MSIRFSIRDFVMMAIAPLTLLTVLDCGGDKGPTGPDSSGPSSLAGTTWEVASVEGAPGPVDWRNSIWRFKQDGTYVWFFRYDPYYDLQGTGAYVQNGTILRLTGIVATTVISEAPDGVVHLTTGADQFSFTDDDGDRWVYRRIADPAIPLREQPSYAGDCRARPAGSTCLGFPDGYVALVYATLIDSWPSPGYWKGEVIDAVDGGTELYYHVTGTTLFATVPKSHS